MADLRANVFYLDGGTDARGLVAASLPGEGGGPVWHPLIPFGKWHHKKYGSFEFTEAEADEMLASFRAYPRTPKGIPVNERADHSKNPDGSFAWLTDMEIRDGALWGQIEYTDMGAAAVSGGRLPYISPHFVVNGEPNEQHGGSRNYIFAAALTDEPFFDQPELRVAASSYEPVLDVGSNDDGIDAVDDADAHSDDVGRGDDAPGGMTMTEQMARDAVLAAMGEDAKITDEQWAEMTAEVDREAEVSWATFLVTYQVPSAEPPASDPPAADPPAEDPSDAAAPEPPAEEPAEVVTTMSALAQAVNDISGRLDAMEPVAAQAAEVAASAAGRFAVADREALKGEIAASKGFGGPNGDRGLAPSAAGVLANVIANPCAETASALRVHLKDNDGFATFATGEVAASGSGPLPDAGTDADDVWLATQGLPQEDMDAARAIKASEGCSISDALSKHVGGLIRR